MAEYNTNITRAIKFYLTLLKDCVSQKGKQLFHFAIKEVKHMCSLSWKKHFVIKSVNVVDRYLQAANRFKHQKQTNINQCMVGLIRTLYQFD